VKTKIIVSQLATSHAKLAFNFNRRNVKAPLIDVIIANIRTILYVNASSKLYLYSQCVTYMYLHNSDNTCICVQLPQRKSSVTTVPDLRQNIQRWRLVEGRA